MTKKTCNDTIGTSKFQSGSGNPADNFTAVGRASRVLLVEEKLSFADAEEYCQDLDAQLIEFMSEDEWKEVRGMMAAELTFSSCLGRGQLIITKTFLSFSDG